MPLCQLFTNVPALEPTAKLALLEDLSRLCAKRFGKPERWVMTCLVPGLAMTFAGTAAPAAFVAVKNVGSMRPDDTATLSSEICARVEKALAVPRDRIYIEFVDAAPHMWGWNGDTFA